MKKIFVYVSMMLIPFGMVAQTQVLDSLSTHVSEGIVRIIGLSVGYFDPTDAQHPIERSPILVPEVSIEDYTMNFNDACYGHEFRLVNGEGETVYSTVITSGILELSSTLEGQFEIQIIYDDWYYYGDIEL